MEEFRKENAIRRTESLLKQLGLNKQAPQPSKFTSNGARKPVNLADLSSEVVVYYAKYIAIQERAKLDGIPPWNDA